MENEGQAEGDVGLVETFDRIVCRCMATLRLGNMSLMFRHFAESELTNGGGICDFVVLERIEVVFDVDRSRLLQLPVSKKWIRRTLRLFLDTRLGGHRITVALWRAPLYGINKTPQECIKGTNRSERGRVWVWTERRGANI